MGCLGMGSMTQLHFQGTDWHPHLGPNNCPPGTFLKGLLKLLGKEAGSYHTSIRREMIFPTRGVVRSELCVSALGARRWAQCRMGSIWFGHPNIPLRRIRS